MKKKKKVYLDYAATTPLDPRVFEIMKPYFSQKFGNPMSLHSFGRKASEAIEKARQRTARFLGCSPDEIVFTSGATESNNLAIKGIILKSEFNGKIKPHIITTQFEHPCVLNTCRALEEQGRVAVTYLPIGKEGIIKVRDVKESIKRSTRLISVMYVNNEIGTIQPIREVGELLKKINAGRDRKIIFHTDATQAIGYLDCKVDNLGVDLLSMSAHKIYGPKGAGCLYVREGTPIKRIQDGGEQESNLRSGTHNVPGIVGLGSALELVAKERKKVYNQVAKLRDYLVQRILREIPDVRLNGSKMKRVPNNANFTFSNVEGEGLLMGLDVKGIAVSTGSACSSENLRPSHVLIAIGLTDEESHGSLRITLGKYTTKQEVDYAISALKDTVSKLRKVAGRNY